LETWGGDVAQNGPTGVTGLGQLSLGIEGAVNSAFRLGGLGKDSPESHLVIPFFFLLSTTRCFRRRDGKMSGSYDFRTSRLWKETLGERPNDNHQEQRARLRTALVQMRERVQPLVAMIQNDCPELTVHDVTHLDALWEMADLLAGSDFELTPAEAFVFGAAVLLHDAGMAALGYPGGKRGIQESIDWRDSFASFFQKKNGRFPSDEEKQNPERELAEQALFDALRRLHAQRAETLATGSIPQDHGGGTFLIEDSDLRRDYGQAIGRIAHSHHWSISDLQSRLRPSTGAAGYLPGEWTVDEIKVACLLRCADITHVDQRRAPSMLYALLQPKGYSNLHWNFQNKLRKPTKTDQSLCYSGGSSFNERESDSWWLCFDSIGLINSELADVDALLLETNRRRFSVRGVRGAGHPRLLAQDIQTDGWQPVAATLNVSNPSKLAQTLGGKNLYGPGGFAPVRELIQNAVDAIRARRIAESRPKSWGSIKLTFEEIKNGVETEQWLHLDDNGVGMSQRTLSETLLDFGRSLWTSAEVREEFPGLVNEGFEPIGKFGIGFFSIFLLGEKIRVISKKYNSAMNVAQVLEFESISKRPIVRVAKTGELPIDYSTRVSARLDRNVLREYLMRRRSLSRFTASEFFENANAEDESLSEQFFARKIKSLVSCLDVDFEYMDSRNSIEFSHSHDWMNNGSAEFLSELYADFSNERLGQILKEHAHRLTVLEDGAGKPVARASIVIGGTKRDSDYAHADLRISVGGLVQSDMSYRAAGPFHSPICGVLPGETRLASRHAAEASLDNINISKWATEQADKFQQETTSFAKRVAVARYLNDLGGETKGLPICFLNGELSNGETFKNFLSKYTEILIPIVERSYNDAMYAMAIGDIPTNFFVNKVRPQVGIFDVRDRGFEFEKELVSKVKASETRRLTLPDTIITRFWSSFSTHGEAPSSPLRKQVNEIWGSSIGFEICKAEIYSPPVLDIARERWVVRMSKGGQ